MATYNSDLMTHKVPFRGDYAGAEFQVTGTIKIKSGVKLLDGDLLKFARLGHGVSVVGIRLSSDGDLDDGTSALAGQLGYFRANDAAGNAIVHDNKTGTTYTSPADSTAYFATAGASVLQAAGVIVYAPTAAAGVAMANYDADGYAGVADVGIEITTSADGDAAADVNLRCTLTCIQKEATQGEWSGDLATAYTNRYTTAGSSSGLVS